MVFSSPVGASASIYPAGSTGVDVSWPAANCNASPAADAAFGIVGVTGGLDFTRNNCLFNESHRFPHLSLYMNTGYPGSKLAKKYANDARHCSAAETNCLAYNYGFAAAQYALLYAASQNIHSTVWWLDVETENSWTKIHRENRAAVEGMMAAIKQSTLFSGIGIYSTPKQWRQIMGDWKNGLPNWVGTGSTKRSTAIAACRTNDFTGGGTRLTQYILTLDHDYVCPNASSTLSRQL